MQAKEVLAHKYVKRLFVARFISNYGNGMGPIGLAIAAPLSTLLGMETFIYILAVITVFAIVLPLFNSEVRNMSYEEMT